MSATKIDWLIDCDGLSTEYDALCRLHALRRVVLDQLDDIRSLVEIQTARCATSFAAYMGACDLGDETDPRAAEFEAGVAAHQRYLEGSLSLVDLDNAIHGEVPS